MWGIGWRGHGYGDDDGWRESAWRRSTRRAGTGIVFLGLAILVRSSLVVLSADAEETVALPEWAQLETPGWDERLAPGQRLPPPRPTGLLLRIRYDVEPGSKAARRTDAKTSRYVGPWEECV